MFHSLADMLHRIAIMMFITHMEVPVLITALVAITEDLGGFGDVGWVVSSYLLGYVGTSNRVQFRIPIMTYNPRQPSSSSSPNSVTYLAGNPSSCCQLQSSSYFLPLVLPLRP